MLLKYNSRALDNSAKVPYNGTKMIKKELVMRGSIRAVVGFFIAFGAVGTLDSDPSASVLLLMAIAVFGLGLMWSGVASMQRDA